jgi:two-component system, chemotaxis family, protein-glutamate methylesterase/glutaminase
MCRVVVSTSVVKKKSIRVVVVDDSRLCRDILRAILEEEGDIEVVGEAADGSEAHKTAARLRPSVITLDIEMPGTDGLTAIGRIMADCPTPILVVTGRPVEQRSATLFEAVRRGALDLFPKPTVGNVEDARALRVLVRRMAAIPVVRHLRTQSMRSPGTPALLPGELSPMLPAFGGGPRGRVRLVGIGASAGGPAAVAAVLRDLPADMPASVAVVQHLLPGFTRPFCDFLRLHTKLQVRAVEERITLRPATVYVAPDERHLVAVTSDELAPLDAAPEAGHRPSVDALFHSMAKVYGNGGVGVILSGMGEDGARGLGAMAKEGALTIAQSEEGCAVYGMPRAAVLRGAARRQLPLAAIAEAIALATREEARS